MTTPPKPGCRCNEASADPKGLKCPLHGLPPHMKSTTVVSDRVLTPDELEAEVQVPWAQEQRDLHELLDVLGAAAGAPNEPAADRLKSYFRIRMAQDMQMRLDDYSVLARAWLERKDDAAHGQPCPCAPCQQARRCLRGRV